MPRWQVRWRCTWLIWRVPTSPKNPGTDARHVRLVRHIDQETNPCLKRLIIFRADFYGEQQPPRIKWRATTRTTSGGSGNKTVIQKGHLVWLAIGGEAAGGKTSTAPRKVDKTLIVFLWSGAAFNQHLILGTKMHWSVIAPCCEDCAIAA